MKSLLAAFAVLGALTTAALADESADDSTSDEAASDEAASDEADNACAAGQDCAKLEGEAKTECEAKMAEADDAEAPAEEKGGKGKGMTESNDGNMESYDEPE